jgi:hypothetical protein
VTRKATFGVALALAIVVAAALIAPMFAGAHHERVTDPKDTRGKLDVRSVIVSGAKMRPNWRINTYPRWTARGIWDRGHILVWLDTTGGRGFDYYVLIRSDGNRMTAALFRYRPNRRDVRIAGLRPWRKNQRSVSVRIPLGRVVFGEKRRRYGWQVQTLWMGPKCRNKVCFDFAPNRNAVMEPIPGVPPKPTPSPSPTNSP